MIGAASNTTVVRVSCRLRLFGSPLRQDVARIAAPQAASTFLSRNFWFALSWTIRSTRHAFAFANAFLAVNRVKRDDPAAQIEFGQQLLAAGISSDFGVDLDVRDGKRRLGRERAEYLPHVRYDDAVDIASSIDRAAMRNYVHLHAARRWIAPVRKSPQLYA